VDWLKRDVFEMAGIPARVERCQPIPHLVGASGSISGCGIQFAPDLCAVSEQLRVTVGRAKLLETGARGVKKHAEAR
jgi:hypothetical protein